MPAVPRVFALRPETTGGIMTRATYRFREHTMSPDPVSEPVLFGWACKTAGCGAKSEPSEDASAGSTWATDHFKTNPDHTAYREIITRAYRFQPGDWQ
ncbi:gp25.3 [Streptomyces phage phiBT1]|uniref:Gp25.3 n=1 Tax=Lomovskayavirus BT1 TaxID=225588 RepID=Q858X4_9CAUD|nr:gp25.3 [Streptomyces phage phiBT1]CAD80151.1 gp25.3 [Lomovskayavirus BT1]